MSAIVDRIQEFTRPTGEETLMSVDYPKPRIRVGVREALVIAGILVIALVAWLMLRGMSSEPAAGETGTSEEVLAAVTGDAAVAGEARPEPSPGLPIPASGTAAGTAEARVPEAATAATVVVVSVVGAVERPGLVTLPEGTRVADALAAAGPLPGAQLVVLNQAQLLSDGEQIFVPAEGEETAPPGISQAPGSAVETASSTVAGPISLNTAGADELTQLNGVGEKTAEAIINHREQIGGFTNLEQLLEVKGIGPAKYADLVDQVSL